MVLPLIGNNLLLALAVLFFIFLAVEITIVTSLPFFIDILGDAQATMMSGRFAAASAGRVIGAMIGGPIVGALLLTMYAPHWWGIVMGLIALVAFLMIFKKITPLHLKQQLDAKSREI